MPQNRLILRQTASPYIFPLTDIVKGSVLSWDEVDGNFIFLKGLNIQSASVSGSDIIFNRIDGNTFSVDISSAISGVTSGQTDVFVTGGTYNDITGDATFVNNTGGTFTVTGFTTGGSSGGYVNNIIPSGTTITVPQNQQYIVYGNLDLYGQLDNLGNVVIINGTLNNGGGTFNNSGTTTFVSFPTGDTSVFTGNTSGTCIDDIFVNNLRPCSGDSYFTQGNNVLNQGINGSAIVYQNPLSADTLSGIIIGNTGNDYTISQAIIKTDGSFTASLTLNLNSLQLVYKNDFNNLSGIDIGDSGVSVRHYVDSGDTKTFSVSASYNTGGTVTDLFSVDTMGGITCPSPTGFFIPPILSTAERDSLTPIAGMMIYNSSTNKHQGYDGGTWNDFY
jgi:hypothetical protein